jgi:hypothetical protein
MQNPPPASYATTAYFGVNSVVFVNAKIERHFVRFVPEAGKHYLGEATRKSMGPNCLSEEIAKRIAHEKGPGLSWLSTTARTAITRRVFRSRRSYFNTAASTSLALSRRVRTDSETIGVLNAGRPT